MSYNLDPLSKNFLYSQPVKVSNDPTAGLKSIQATAAKQQVLPAATQAPRTSTPTYENGGWYQSPNGRVQQYFNGQWFDSPQNTVNQSQPLSDASGNAESSIDYDAMYAPVFSSYDASEQAAKDNALLGEQDVLGAKKKQLGTIELEEQKATNKFDTSKKTAAENKTTAYEEAIRLLKAMEQQGRARFGRGSSAGEAVSELVQREFWRNQGGIQKRFDDAVNEIDTQARAAALAFTQAKLALDEWEQTEYRKIKRQLTDTITNIKQARAQTEAEKTAKRMAALEAAKELANSVKLQKQQQTEAIQQWKEQQMWLLEKNLVPTYNNFNPNTSGYQPTSSTLSYGGTQGTGTPLSTLRWNSRTKSFDTDEELNPIQAYA